MLPPVTQGARHAAAKPASPDEIEVITDKLDKLRSNYGVWRDGLADFLGQQLCDRLHVVTRSQPGGPEVDSAEEVRAKLIWHLRRLISGLNTEEENRRSASISFNITPYPELRAMRSVKDRVQWGSEHGLCKARKAVDTRTGRIIPDLARELGKTQPVPPRKDIEAILAEFRGDTSSPEQAPEPTIQARKTPLWRRPRVLITAGVVFLVVAVVSVVALVRSQSSGDLPMGDHMRVEVLSITNSAFTWPAAFPADRIAAAEPFIRQDRRPDDPWEFLQRELDAGAYVVGGINVGLVLEGNSDDEITIYNVRPLVTPGEEPTGVYISIQNEVGGSSAEFAFNLDEATPVAREVLSTLGEVGEEYFGIQQIGLRNGEKFGLTMRFDADRRAYSFYIEVQYEVAGEKYRIRVDRSGQPFRVTPSPCEYSVIDDGAVSAEDMPVGDIQYTHFRYDIRPPDEDSWRMVTGDPSNVCVLPQG